MLYKNPLVIVVLLLTVIFAFFFINNSTTNERQLEETQSVKLACEDYPNIFDDLTLNFTDADQKALDNLVSRKGGNYIYDFLKTADTKTYVLKQSSQFIPWLVVIVLTLIWGFAACIWAICQCCSKGNCCVRKLKKKPYKKAHKIVPCVCSLLLIAGFLAVCIQAYVIVDRSNQATHKIACLAASISSSFIYGSSNQYFEWAGLTGFIDVLVELQSIVKQLPNTNYQVLNTDWTNLVDPYYSKIDNYYATYKDEQLVSPESGSSKEISSTAIEQLGPTDDSATVTGLIYIELTATDEMNYNLGESFNVISGYDEDASIASNAFVEAQSSMETFKIQMLDYDSNLAAILEPMNRFNNGFFIVMYLAFGIGLGAALIYGIFMIIGYFVTSNKICRVCMCLCKLLLFLVTLYTAAVSTVLFPVSGIMIDICDLTGKIIDNESEIDLFSGFMTAGDASVALTTCLYGDGDLSATYGFDEALSEVDSIFSSIATYNQMFESDLGVYDISESPTMSEFSKEFEEILDFEIPATILASASDPTLNLENINLWADYSLDNSYQKDVGDCSVSQDTIVFKEINCNSSAIKSVDADFGDKVCVPIEKYANSYDQRYTSSNYASCKNSVDEEIRSGWESLNNYRESVIEVFDPMKSDLDDIHKQYQKNVLSEYDRIENYAASVTELFVKVNDILFNNATGLVSAMNCTFIRTTVILVKNEMCSSFITNFMWVTALLGTLCGLSFLSMIVFCCTYKNFANHEHHPKKIKPTEGSENGDEKSEAAKLV